MRRTIGLMLGLGLLVAGCGGDASSEATPFSPTDTILADGADTAAAGSETTIAGDLPAAESRRVIRTGTIEIRVTDTRAAMDQITGLVDRTGGYVSTSRVNPMGEGLQPSIYMEVRVPAEDLPAALVAIRKLADEVVAESTESQDVTAEYTDVESRLRNLTALETELVALLTEVRQQPNADPQKLLAVFTEIGRVRGEIEVLEGRRRLIDDQTALSALTIGITQVAVERPLVEERWQPLVTVRRAAGSLVDALRGLVDVAIWVAIYLLPVLVLIGVPVWLLVRLLTRRNRAAGPPSPAPPAPPPTPPAPAPAERSTV